MNLRIKSAAAQRSFQQVAKVLVIAAACSSACLAADSGAASANDQYKQALYLRETGQPYAAIESLEALLANSPTLNRARLELAVAYYRTLDYANARQQAQKVLNDPKTPESVRLSVASFLKQLELEEATVFGKPHRWDFNVSAGLLHDSNVNAGPDNALLPNGLTLSDASLKRADTGFTVNMGATHTWTRATPVRLGDSPARFSWVTQANAYQKTYTSANEHNLTVMTLATGPALQLASGHRGNLNVQADYLRLGSDWLGMFSTVTPSFTWKLGRGELTADVQWSRHAFQRSADQGRNGEYRAASLSYGHVLSQMPLTYQVGITGFQENTQDWQFGNRGHELFAGLRYRAWEGGDLFLREAYRQSRYIDETPTFDVRRRDNELRSEIGASHRFGSGVMDKWLLSCTVSHTHNGSNIAMYEFGRTVTSITLGKEF